MCVCATTGLLQMQLILHYDMTYREVKYSNLGLEDIDRKILMGINVTPVISLLYTPVLIRLDTHRHPQTRAHAAVFETLHLLLLQVSRH